MKLSKVLEINNKEFGIGVFIKKETLLSNFNYLFYVRILWFTIGFAVAYKNKYN